MSSEDYKIQKQKLTNSNNFASFFGFSIILLTLFSTFQYFFLNNASNIKRLYNSSTVINFQSLPNGNKQFNFIVITDLDHQSFKPNKKCWQSFLYKGIFTLNKNENLAYVDWNKNPEILESQISANNRGMELSDLVKFDGSILSVDDRTGLIYKITEFKNVIPWIFLNDGPGNTSKGFKAEWMTVKDQHLYVGGLGKEWTTQNGIFVNYNPMYIKIVNHFGEIKHVDWIENYKKLRRTVGIEFPGYMIFESGIWSDIHQKWFFLPRRASKEIYSEIQDENKGTNILLIASENFENIVVKAIGNKSDKTRGFSAFQFLPDSNDTIIVALKSQEKNGTAVASYITSFNWETGKILLEEQRLPGEAYKFEGLLFI